VKYGPEIGVKFSYSSPAGTLPFQDEELEAHLPLDRPGAEEKTSLKITYKSYLRGIRHFILGNWDRFVAAVTEQAPGGFQQVAEIEIIAEKHGSDYHPARLRARVGESHVDFVVNVALTDRGKKRLLNEFQLLNYLHSEHRQSFIPRVYFLERECLSGESGDKMRIVMFLGEWFDGYHEFHLSCNPQTGSLITVLWDMDRGHVELSSQEVQEIYRQAAFILTYYYDTERYCEIFPWHHASGDFVVCRSDAGIQVKLVTVRQYISRIVFEENRPENRIEALLIFLANLTVRMRLDRLDGIGDTLWAGGHCVQGTVSGFFEGLAAKASIGSSAPPLRDELLRLLSRISPGHLAELFEAVVESYHKDAPDVAVILEHLPEHVFQVYQILKQVDKLNQSRT